MLARSESLGEKNTLPYVLPLKSDFGPSRRIGNRRRTLVAFMVAAYIWIGARHYPNPLVKKVRE